MLWKKLASERLSRYELLVPPPSGTKLGGTINFTVSDGLGKRNHEKNQSDRIIPCLSYQCNEGLSLLTVGIVPARAKLKFSTKSIPANHKFKIWNQTWLIKTFEQCMDEARLLQLPEHGNL